VTPRERSSAEKREAEPLDDGRGGIDGRQPQPVFRHFGQRIDDRRGVHPDLREKRNEVAEIPILCSEGRKEKAEAKADRHQVDQDHRQHPRIGGHRQLRARFRIKTKIDPKAEEAECLQREGHKLDRRGRERRNQAREVNFPIQPGVGRKAGRSAREDVGDKSKTQQSALIEEELRKAVGGDPGEASKDHRKHHHRDQWLNDVPNGAEHRLPVFREKIPSDHQHAEVTESPQLPHPRLPPRTVGFDHYFASKMHVL